MILYTFTGLVCFLLELALTYDHTQIRIETGSFALYGVEIPTIWHVVMTAIMSNHRIHRKSDLLKDFCTAYHFDSCSVQKIFMLKFK